MVHGSCRTSKTKYPEGWELIEPTLTELETKMREGTAITTRLYTPSSSHMLRLVVWRVSPPGCVAARD
jgi:hypothetical protein